MLKMRILFVIWLHFLLESVLNRGPIFFDYGLNPPPIGEWPIGCHYMLWEATNSDYFVAVTLDTKWFCIFNVLILFHAFNESMVCPHYLLWWWNKMKFHTYSMTLWYSIFHCLS